MPHKNETTLQGEFKKQNFKSEAEEAQWWDSNQDLLADAFEKAAANGTLGRGTTARKAAVPTTTIRLDPADISKARIHAERKGLKYQTYLKMLIREALTQEDLKAGAAVPRTAKAATKQIAVVVPPRQLLKKKR